VLSFFRKCDFKSLFPRSHQNRSFGIKPYVPIGIYRGFRSLTDAPDALLMAIIGGPDAGKVDWHPSVLEEARKTGLSVDDVGNLIIEKPAA
jgi:hypothetical protein